MIRWWWQLSRSAASIMQTIDGKALRLEAEVLFTILMEAAANCGDFIDPGARQWRFNGLAVDQLT